MRTSTVPFVTKYCPTKFEDFVMVEGRFRRHRDLLQSFFEDPSCSHWLLHGNPGLGKSTMAGLMARRVANQGGYVWQMTGNKLTQKALAEIEEKTIFYASGLFHAVIIEEADAILPCFQETLLQTLDPTGMNQAKNTCWIFTTNKEPKLALDERLVHRMNPVLFTSEGIHPLATRHLLRIADTEGFVLTESQAAKIVQESKNNIRQSVSELERWCRAKLLTRKDGHPRLLAAAA